MCNVEEGATAIATTTNTTMKQKPSATVEPHSQSFDDDQQMLLDIQQNIQNLERTLSNQGRRRMMDFQ